VGNGGAVAKGPAARRGRDAALVAVLLVALGALQLFDERIQVRDGLGYDGGDHYGRWAIDFPGRVLDRGLDSYYVQRCLPSAVVYYGLRLAGVVPSPAAAIAGFALLNVVCVVAAAVVWLRIAGELRLSGPGRVLGLVALFGNYVVLKWSVYCSVMTDMPAYLSGPLMLLFFLKRRRLALAGVTLAAAFVWPTALVVGILLILFPRPRRAAPPALVGPRPPAVFVGLLCAAVLAGVAFLVLVRYVLEFDAEPPLYALLPLSAAVAVAYLAASLYPLLRLQNLYLAGHWLRRLLTWDALLAAAVFLAARAIQARLSNGKPSFDLGHRLRFTLMTSIAKPGVCFLAAVVLYGPLVLAAAFLWRPICRLVHAQGMGLTLVAVLGVLVALCSEQRGVMNLYPMLVPFVVAAMDEARWPRAAYWLLGVLTVLSSKIWLPINSGPFTADPATNPGQKYFLTHGPWMATPAYLLQGTAVLACAAALFLLVRRKPVPEGEAVTAPAPSAAGGPPGPAPRS
jgi:hypothetical protein